MNVDFRRYRIESAAARDSWRPILLSPYLDTKRKRLVATNTFILASVPVEIEDEDTDGPIPLAAIAAARKLQRKDGVATITANSTATVPGFAAFDRPEQTQFPDHEKLLKAVQKAKPAFTIGLSPKLLHDLAKALGSEDSVQLDFEGPLKPICVTPRQTGGGGEGVLMPIRLA